MISTRDPSGLPDIRVLRRLTRSLAVLDAVLFPEWEERYHSFDASWSTGELMASPEDVKRELGLGSHLRRSPSSRPGARLKTAAMSLGPGDVIPEAVVDRAPAFGQGMTFCVVDWICIWT